MYHKRNIAFLADLSSFRIHQPKITFVSRLETRALRRTTLSLFFALCYPERAFKITSVAKILLNLIVPSLCRTSKNYLFVIRVLFVSSSFANHFPIIPQHIKTLIGDVIWKHTRCNCYHSRTICIANVLNSSTFFLL